MSIISIRSEALNVPNTPTVLELENRWALLVDLLEKQNKPNVPMTPDYISPEKIIDELKDIAQLLNNMDPRINVPNTPDYFTHEERLETIEILINKFVPNETDYNINTLNTSETPVALYEDDSFDPRVPNTPGPVVIDPRVPNTPEPAVIDPRVPNTPDTIVIDPRVPNTPEPVVVDPRVPNTPDPIVIDPRVPNTPDQSIIKGSIDLNDVVSFGNDTLDDLLSGFGTQEPQTISASTNTSSALEVFVSSHTLDIQPDNNLA